MALVLPDLANLAKSQNLRDFLGGNSTPYILRSPIGPRKSTNVWRAVVIIDLEDVVTLSKKKGGSTEDRLRPVGPGENSIYIKWL